MYTVISVVKCTAGEVHLHINIGYSTQEGNHRCSSQCLMEESHILMCPRQYVVKFIRIPS